VRHPHARMESPQRRRQRWGYDRGEPAGRRGRDEKALELSFPADDAGCFRGREGRS